MRHAAHKAAGNSVRGNGSDSLMGLFSGSRGTHTRGNVIAMQMAGNNGAVLGLDGAVADKLNELAPMSRRAIREAARAAERRNFIVGSASLAALAGTSDDIASSTVADSTQQDVSSDGQTQQTSNEGTWSLGSADTAIDSKQMSKSLANNENVAKLMDQDSALLPSGFDPNHATGDIGNAYEFSQCTWWVYVRRHELGLPVGSHMGNGNMWANSARALGYWVDNTPRHVGDIMVFRAGQEGSDSSYGHVAIVEKINDDGSITTSECGSVMNGKTYSKTYNNVSDFEYIHY